MPATGLNLLLLLMFVSGAWLIARGWRGRPVLTHPTCAQCKYDLRGLDPAIRRACPECGADLASPRAVHFGRLQKQPRLMIVGALVLLVPLSYFSGKHLMSHFGLRWSDLKPDAWIIADLATTADQPWTWQELERRYAAGRLSAAEVAATIDHLIAHLIRSRQRTGPQPFHWADSFVGGVISDQRVAKPQLHRLYEAHFGVPPRITIRQRARSGAPVQFALDAGNPWSLPGVAQIVSLHAITLSDGTNVPSRDVFGNERQLSAGADFTSLHGSFLLSLPPGQHPVSFLIDVGLVSEADGDQFGPHRPPGPPDHWPPTFHHWQQTAQVVVEVLPSDQSPIELVRDPALAGPMRAGISIQSLQVLTRGTRQELRLEIDFDHNPSAAVCFDVLARIDGTEHALGHFSAHNGGASWSDFSARLETGAVPPTSADIILRPSPERAEQSLDLEAIWGEEIVFEDVPIAPDEPLP